MVLTLTGGDIKAGTYKGNNRILGSPRVSPDSYIEFRGTGCSINFGDRSTFQGSVRFRRDESSVSIGERSLFRGQMSLGHGCEIILGNDIYCGVAAYVTTAEGASIRLGNDLLISDRFQARADDSHPIYDANSGHRINPSKSIVVEDHVWIGADVIMMPGSMVGRGSVVGIRSMVTKSRPVPPNSLAVGSPVEVVRSNIHWVRKHLQTSADIDDAIDPVPTTDV